MTKLCSGQGNPAAAAATKDDDTNAADANTANESNPYMSPFQATQKLNIKVNFVFGKYQMVRHQPLQIISKIMHLCLFNVIC